MMTCGNFQARTFPHDRERLIADLSIPGVPPGAGVEMHAYGNDGRVVGDDD